MRQPRPKGRSTCFYHCMSKIYEGRFVFKEYNHKDEYMKYMRKLEAFSGVEILTYTFLDNHFHILLKVPEREEISDNELARRIRCLYGDIAANDFVTELAKYVSENSSMADLLRTKYLYRMYDLSYFMKSLKQWFSQRYNALNNTSGSIWTGRFKSILLEPKRELLLTIAGYVDLNSIRAGVVKDPMDYQYCGYADALRGSEKARNAISYLMNYGNDQKLDWNEAAKSYRVYLYVIGEGSKMRGNKWQAGFTEEEVKEVIKKGGEINKELMIALGGSLNSDGSIIGSSGFIKSAAKEFGGKWGINHFGQVPTDAFKELGNSPRKKDQISGTV